MTRRAVVGTVYLLHFNEPFGHARHYQGWSENLANRLRDHHDGRGAKLVAAVNAAGIEWQLARTWEGTRALERRLKRQGGGRRRCPLCGVKPRPLRGPA